MPLSSSIMSSRFSARPPLEVMPIVLPFMSFGPSMGFLVLLIMNSGEACVTVAMAFSGAPCPPTARIRSTPPVRQNFACPESTCCTACAEPLPPCTSTLSPSFSKCPPVTAHSTGAKPIRYPNGVMKVIEVAARASRLTTDSPRPPSEAASERHDPVARNSRRASAGTDFLLMTVTPPMVAVVRTTGAPAGRFGQAETAPPDRSRLP